MHLTRARFEVLDIDALQAFLGEALPEDHHLDYKRQSYEKGDKGRAELAKDVSAFASADGGLLVIGVGEPGGGEPGEVPGIEGGAAEAHRLEQRLLSTLEPRVPGLGFRAVRWSHSRDVLVVFVPPSIARPHQSADGRFYLRHTETITSMRVDEIKAMVLGDAGRKERLVRRLDALEDELVDTELRGGPGFVLQAIPAVVGAPVWDVHGEPFRRALKGDARAHEELHPDTALLAMPPPQVGMEKLRGAQARDANSRWATEVHRDGAICAVYPHHYTKAPGLVFVGPDSAWLFFAFGRLVERCLEAADCTGLEVMIRARYHRADALVFLPDEPVPSALWGPWRRERLVLPDVLAGAALAPSLAVKHLAESLWHAFGRDVMEAARPRMPPSWAD